MAIFVGQPFKRTGMFPIDEDMILTKEQMRAVEDDLMPDLYFALCSDDGNFYIYRKSATASLETGKFTLMENGGISDITFIAPEFDSSLTYIIGDVVTYNGKRYVAKNDISTPGDFVPSDWIEQDVQTAIDSISGDAKIGSDYTTNITVGGLASGTEIHKDDTIASILKRMLVTTYYPTYVAPSASLNYSASALMKVGVSVPAMPATINFNPGAIMLQGAKQNDRAGAATGYGIATSGADSDFSDSGVSPTFSIPALKRSSPGSVTIVGSASYAAGPQPKDSDGKDYQEPLGAGSVNTSVKTIDFILPFYYGVSDIDVVAEFTGLTEDLTKKGTKTVKYTTNAQYVVFAYDASYGDLTSIKDRNDYDYITGFNKSTLVVEGQTYNVYVQKYKTTDTEAPYIFRF